MFRAFQQLADAGLIPGQYTGVRRRLSLVDRAPSTVSFKLVGGTVDRFREKSRPRKGGALQGTMAIRQQLIVGSAAGARRRAPATSTGSPGGDLPVRMRAAPHSIVPPPMAMKLVPRCRKPPCPLPTTYAWSPGSAMPTAGALTSVT